MFTKRPVLASAILAYRTTSRSFLHRHFNTERHYGSTAEKDTIVKLLYNIGSKKEVEQYIRHFSSVDSQKFAVIKVGGAVLTDELDVLASSLTFLYRVGLYPIVVHGAGPQLNDMLAAAGITPHYADGIRVTDAQTLHIARKCFQSENLKLVEKLEELGTKARPIVGGLFTAEFLNREKYGLVGRITSVNKAAVESSIRSGALPIVTSLAESTDGQILNINADTAAGELARCLEPLKIIFLNSGGGMVHPRTQQKMDVINLDEGYADLVAELSQMSKKGTLLKLNEIKQLLDHLPRSSSVAITSAEHLSKELFTDGGAGTLIRRGYRLFHGKPVQELDMGRFRELLQEHDTDILQGTQSVASYLSSLDSSTHVRVYGDEAYESVAIVKDLLPQSKIALLDKFVSTRSAVLNNVVDNVWSLLRKDYSKLVWAIDGQDESRGWFFDKCDGSVTVGKQIIFYYGIQDLKELQQCLDVFQRPQTASAKVPTGKRSFHTATFGRQLCASTAATATKRVGLIGARGYTGQELMDLIDGHPSLELAYVSSRELAGKPMKLKSNTSLLYSNLSPDETASIPDVDCWVMALPNGVCRPWVEAIEKKRKSSHRQPVIVDLSADYRFSDNWTYGLPELYSNTRQHIRQSHLISNPGCYATGTQLALYPLVSAGLIQPGQSPSVFGVSGYSGAGTKPSPKNDPAQLKDNLIPYALSGHLHEREVSSHLQRCHSDFKQGIHFMPHVASFFRGITLTVNMPLSKSISIDTVRSLYSEHYDTEPLVRVLGEQEGALKDGVPLVREIMGKHGVQIGAFTLSKDGKRLTVVATLDNLLKGAATQCLQNMNLSLGFHEFSGVPAFKKEK